MYSSIRNRMEEPAIVSVQSIIPYFFFCEIRQENIIYLYVHMNNFKFTEVKFLLRDNVVLVSTNVKENHQYKASISLPIEVIHPENPELPVVQDEHSAYYKLYFKKSSFQSKHRTPDLDVISCHLSWRDRTIREPPDMLISKPPCTSVAENIIECLGALKLSDTAKTRTGCYGFACRYTDKMSTFEGNWISALELTDPDCSDITCRRLLRWEKERQSFDVEHYLADYFFERNQDDDDDSLSIQGTIRCRPYWHSIQRATEKKLETHDMLVLAGLPSKDLKLNANERLEVLHSLFDIILAYAYDYRLTRGLGNSESAWNIAKLSATLSWFQVHRHVGDAIESFMRRSLTYPVCRSWILSIAVYNDTLEIFNLGRRQILNCLIRIYEIFDGDEDRKFLNELYIKDYLIWIQQVHPKTIRNYLRHINSCQTIKKENVIAELPRIEQTAVGLFEGDEMEYNAWCIEFDELSTFMDNRSLNQGGISDSSSCDSSIDSYTSFSDSSTDSDSDTIETIKNRS